MVSLTFFQINDLSKAKQQTQQFSCLNVSSFHSSTEQSRLIYSYLVCETMDITRNQVGIVFLCSVRKKCLDTRPYEGEAKHVLFQDKKK